MVALIALAVVAGLMFLPLGIKAKYDEGGAAAWLTFGPLRSVLYPAAKKEKKAKKAEKPEEPKKTDGKAKKGGSYTDFFPLIEALMDFLGELLGRKMRVKNLQANLVLAGDDPCDLAVNYGKACAALGNLVPLLERCFVINKRDLQVQCDFTADKTLIDAQLEVTITLGRILVIAVVYGFRAIVEFLKIKNKRKGGASK